MATIATERGRGAAHHPAHTPGVSRLQPATPAACSSNPDVCCTGDQGSALLLGCVAGGCVTCSMQQVSTAQQVRLKASMGRGPLNVARQNTAGFPASSATSTVTMHCSAQNTMALYTPVPNSRKLFASTSLHCIECDSPAVPWP
jgi:hypothetical protein